MLLAAASCRKVPAPGAPTLLGFPPRFRSCCCCRAFTPTAGMGVMAARGCAAYMGCARLMNAMGTALGGCHCRKKPEGGVLGAGAAGAVRLLDRASWPMG